MKHRQLEILLWSIAFPGFGQLLNHHFIKGLVFILFEVIINMNSLFNTAIKLSFTGEIQEAVEVTNYQWLMFYPCLYVFAIWDAYKNSQINPPPYAFLPFVFSAYFITVGLIYSPHFKLFGILLGPIWLPILSIIPGIIVGFGIRWIILSVSEKQSNPS
ncbi:hypothetical protein [Halobacillus seohaensis]|uniref:Uncharacterized protein n=1 Tax=Halobacillus seohaensis TaxID=447421 RepID=A0ABW2EPB7_9BACI